MSAPFNLNGRQVADLGDALRDLTILSRNHHVYISHSGYPSSLQIGDNHIEIKWDEETNEYVIDDRIGS